MIYDGDRQDPEAASSKPAAGDAVGYSQSQPPSRPLERGPSPLEILYEDGTLLAINKPPGLLTHRSAQGRDRVTALSLLRDQLGHWVWPLHRLDRKTSGILLFAKNPEAAKEGYGRFARGSVRKSYLAIVRGWLREAGELDYPLRNLDTGELQEAKTRYRPLGQVELPIAVPPFASSRYSFVEVQPLTGRTHQIRRHLRHLSHPIIGDTKHGEADHNRMFRAEFGWHRLFLHAHQIRLIAEDGAEVHLVAPVEPEFQAALDRFSWKLPEGKWLSD